MEEWVDEEWFSPSSEWRLSFDVWIKDMAAAVESYSTRFGFDQWKYSELKAPALYDARFRGEPVELDMRAAMSSIGPLNIELLEVRDGSESVLRWANEMPDGYWHPVTYHGSAEAADQTFAQFESRGFKPVLSGCVADSHFYMLDATDLFGRMFEIAGGPLTTLAWSPSGA
jgi:Glyoxalase/Bleomycin resistance protein/Dioxygenase superfamily